MTDTETRSNPVSTAVAERREADARDPRKLVERYTNEFAEVLPTHVKSAMFVRQAQSALRRGKITNGEYDLVTAARNNPQAFINALREAARLGLTPGSDEFYLTPVKNKGRLEILGYPGYQGYIELMYRAGAVSSVVVETVSAGERFEFMRGRDEKPLHEVNWRAERGELELVYAYANMKDGGTSYVVILNQFDIKRIMSKSASARFDNSPWQTDPRAMWLKSAIRQLRKWVPTSAEYVNTLARAAVEAHTAPVDIPNVPDGRTPVPLGHQVQITDADEVVEGEVVEDGAPPAAQAPEPPVPVAAPVAEQAPPPVEEPPLADPTVTRMSKAQQREMMTLFAEKGFSDSNDRHDYVKEVLDGIVVASSADLSAAQASQVIEALGKLSPPAPAAQGVTDVELPSDEPAR